MRTLIIIFILSIQFTFSQTIVDMAGDREMEHYKNGLYYIKDINGYFNDFVGTWKYEYDSNKEFRIVITKVEMYHETGYGDDFYIDGLYLQYEKYESGNLIYSSTQDTDSPVGIAKENGKVGLTFFDYQRLSVGFNADLSITEGRNETRLHFLLDKFESENPYYHDNPNESFFSVPNDIIMIKME